MCMVDRLTIQMWAFLPPGGDASQGNLDPADFPILGNRTAMPNPLPAGRNYGEYRRWSRHMS